LFIFFSFASFLREKIDKAEKKGIQKARSIIFHHDLSLIPKTLDILFGLKKNIGQLKNGRFTNLLPKNDLTIFFLE
jgi:hypothetical protein